MKKKLTHVGPDGAARMVDVSDKGVTAREAVARGRIRMSSDALALATSGANKKGDPLQTARLAGIMAAKRTSELIPLCHPLQLSFVDVALLAANDGFEIESRVRLAVRCAWRNGRCRQTKDRSAQTRWSHRRRHG